MKTTINVVVSLSLALLFAATRARECLNECDDSNEPVCGSDGNTYNNPCMLDRNACDQDRKIFMVHRGRCNPCINHECLKPPGSQCVVSDDGLPECVCTYKCLPFKREVCGSDGRTYKNKCEMRKSSCAENIAITVANAGPCGGRGRCKKIKCPGTSVCKMIRGRAKCVSRHRCRLFCPRNYKPVCGTNGKTYSNRCVLERMACKRNVDVMFSYEGRCRVARGACRRKTCPTGMYCQITRRLPRCVRVCQRFCPRIYHPLCAADGRTYSSECARKREACLTNTKIDIVHSGICRDSQYGCELINCGPHHVCKNIFGRPKCYKRVCKRWCQKVYRPVCASDGKTYPNQCTMEKESCQNRKIVKKLHLGRCSLNVGCQISTCIADKKPYSRCVMMNGKPRCVCKTKCPYYRQQVCGSNQKTYRTKCHLELESCQTAVKINVVYNGPCIETCETKKCQETHPYSVCHINEEKLECVCPSSCSNQTDKVCGSDGKIYDNLCIMKETSCRSRKLITLRIIGNCPVETCSTKNCSSIPYSSCQMVDNQPTCICPSSCTKIIKPVCGTDNITYDNYCVLEKTACTNRTIITIKYNGRCANRTDENEIEYATCSNKNCSSIPYSSCQLVDNQPTCVCPAFCNKTIKPVCGTDDITYDNYCLLEKTACTNRTTITIKYNGRCKGTNVIKNATCSTKNCSSIPYSSCQMVDNQPTCVCPAFCTKIIKPVCGTDDITYDNYCVLEKTACNNRTTITIKYNGRCKYNNVIKNETCSTKNCSSIPYSSCQMVDNQPTCVCPAFCAKIIKPVCGTDDITYDNYCLLVKTACTNRTTITIKYNGRCKGTNVIKNATCSTKNCSSIPYSSCQMVDNQPTCVCPAFCTKIIKPVCGTDDITYDNYCVLEKTACNNRTTITIKYNGRCKYNNVIKNETCSTKNCSSIPYSSCQMVDNQPTCVCPAFCAKIIKPVCGTDDITYDNYCLLVKTACTNRTTITIKYNGRCKDTNEIEYATCSNKNCSSIPYSSCQMVDNQPTCVCPSSCTKIIKPVCGTDDITYDNYCLLEKTACTSNTTITIKYNGQCSYILDTEKATCFTKNCSSIPYSSCQMVDNQPTCVCPLFCTKKIKPVCGTDDITYDNYCLLEKTACTNRTNITIKYNGRCKDATQKENKAMIIADACKKCLDRPYSRCLKQSNQSSPKCTCNRNCSMSFEPLCGSDGITYFNLCEMQLVACVRNITITMKTKGFCENLCLRKDCTIELPYSSCQLVGGIPTCVCQPECKDIYQPVCGTDNVNYTNECMMRKTSCEMNSWITMRNEGPCVDIKARAQPINSPCETKNCSGIPYSTCKIVDSKATCSCPESCNHISKPVCGSNGVTYINYCMLQVTSCIKKSLIEVKSNGTCPDLCLRKNCTIELPYSSCQLVGGIPTCVCQPECKDIYQPVCGTDNVNYTNECMMRKTSCEMNSWITMRNEGPCVDIKARAQPINSPCETKNCSGIPYSTCKIIDGKATCSCPWSCYSTYKPVCGSDGVTYINYCRLQILSCLRKSLIKVKSNGKCPDLTSPCPINACSFYAKCRLRGNTAVCICPKRVFCPRKYIKKQCGSDGRTYPNRCLMEAESCAKRTLIFNIGCPEKNCKVGSKCSSPPYSTCRLSRGTPLCKCSRFCYRDFKPVCGSDHMVYGNLCTLQKMACIKKTVITAVNMNYCRPLTDCHNVVCRRRQTCKMISNKPRCVNKYCQRQCQSTYRPVCGSDNVTYRNYCEMRRKICMENVRIRRKNNGPCK